MARAYWLYYTTKRTERQAFHRDGWRAAPGKRVRRLLKPGNRRKRRDASHGSKKTAGMAVEGKDMILEIKTKFNVIF
jgi:hypothetical protein